MAKNPKFIKNLLTTASMLAIAAGSTSAMGAVTTTGGNETLSLPGGWNLVAPVDGDTIAMRAGNADNINANRVGAVIAGIRTSGNAGSVMTINESLSIGAINNGGVAGNTIAMTFGVADKVLTFTGTPGDAGDPAVDNILGLGDITFFAGGAGHGGTVTVQATSGNQMTFAGAVAGGVNGTLNVNTSLIATSAVAGTTVLSIAAVNIGNNATLTVRPTAAAVTVGSAVNLAAANSRLVLDSSAAGGAATFTLNVGKITGAGVLELLANGQDLIVAPNAAETIGTDAANRLEELVISGANTVNVNVNTFAKKITVGVGAGLLTFGELVNSGVDGTLVLTGDRDITFNQNVTIGDGVGAASGINLAGFASTITVANGRNLVGNIKNGGAGTTVKIEGGNYTGTMTGIPTVVVGAGGDVAFLTADATHSITDLQLTVGQKLTLPAGFKNTGDINQAGGAAGNIEFLGDATIDGNIGVGVVVGVVQLTNASTLNVSGAAIKAASVQFNADGVLNLTHKGAIVITGNVVTNAVTRGSIVAKDATDLTINGAIAGAGNSLKLVQSSGNITLVGATRIATIDLNKSAGKTLSLNGVNELGVLANYDSNTTIKLAGASSIKVLAPNTALNLGTADARIGGIDLDGKVLTVGDGVNIYARTDRAANTGIRGAGASGLVFEGSSIVDSAFLNPLATIGINGGAGKTVTFIQDVQAVAVNLAANSTVQFTGNVRNLDGSNVTIDGVGANQGIVEFINPSDAIVHGKVGDANGVATIKLSGKGNVEIDNKIKAQAIVFNTTDPLKLSLTGVAGAAASLDGVAITTTSTAANQTILISADTNLGVGTAIGTAANQLGSLQIANNATITVTGALANAYTGITTTTAGTGNVDFNGGTATGIRNLGAKDAGLNTVSLLVGASGQSVGDVYATNISVDNGVLKVTGNVGGSVAGTPAIVKLAGVAGEFSFADNANATLDAKIDGTAGGDGKVTFLGAANITQAIGATKSLAQVTFTAGADKVVNVGANISATTIGLTDNRYNLTADATLAGNNVNFTGSTLNVGTNTLTVNVATNTAINGAITLNSSFDGTDNGALVFTGAGAAAAGGANLNINFTDNNKGAAVQDGTTLTLLDVNGLTVPGAKANIIGIPATFVQTNLATSLAKWTYTPATGIITSSDNSQVAVANVAKILQLDTDVAKDLAAVLSGGNTNDAFRGEMSQLFNRSGGKDAAAYMAQLDAVTAVTDALYADTHAVTGDISNRVAAVTAPEQLVQAAVAAGDEDSQRHGVWLNPFYGQATQKLRKGVAGYKAKSTGATVGFDTMANDTMTVGIAATMSKANVKHRNDAVGAKTKADTVMFSIYGLQQFATNWFMQGVATFGSTKVKTTTPHRAVNAQTAVAKYDVMSYGGEVLVGYNHKLAENTLLTPMFGMSYAKFNESGYTETGTIANRKVAKKSVDKLEAVFGMRASMDYTMDNMLVTPEVHALVRQSLNSKTPKMDVRIDGLTNPLSAKAAKPAKTFYNLGLGVNAKSGAMEYGAGYDLTLANKYVGHQGSLKIRLNF